ncbi:MAG: hypothetical protein WC458_01010 [Patescibacteria group bacterium]|jgi:hypothetical protein
MLTNQPLKARPRSNIFAGQKARPRLSLNLHTMPQTSDRHFKKWLFLAILVFGLMVLVAFSIFWQ